MKFLLSILGIRSDFERLFYINEYKTLSGEKGRIIMALILILFLTLLALGYAVGSIQNLERKMSNPFTNWVDLSISEKYISLRAKEIEKDYSSSAKKEALQLNDVRGWVMFNLEMYHQKFSPVVHTSDTLVYSTWGRSLEMDDPLMGQILSEDNLVWKNAAFNIEEEEGLDNCEMIITEEMLNRLGYDANNLELGQIFIREEGLVLPITIVGVIKELPKFCNFVCSPQLYNILTAKRDGIKDCGTFIIKNDENKSNFQFIAAPNIELNKLQDLSKIFFNGVEQPDIRLANEIISGQEKWQVCEFSFLPSDQPTLDSIQQFISFSKQKGSALVEVIHLECSVNACNDLDPKDYYYLAFNFDRLDDIRRFKDDMKENHNVDIDMSQVEAKENFALVSRLTLVISLILLAFGILSIILFVNNLLKTHLSKVRSNLGTFKAFGLGNYFLNSTYLKIIFSFLILSILVALGITIIVDRVEQFVMQDESQFNIFSIEVFLALLGLVLISLFISFRTIREILGDTPGNLIYGR